MMRRKQQNTKCTVSFKCNPWSSSFCFSCRNQIGYLGTEDIYVTLKSHQHITCFSGQLGHIGSRKTTIVQCSVTLLTLILGLLMPTLSKGCAAFFFFYLIETESCKEMSFFLLVYLTVHLDSCHQQIFHSNLSQSLKKNPKPKQQPHNYIVYLEISKNSSWSYWKM